MKPKRKTDLYTSKPKATQRRNSLLRSKDELRRRSVRIVLSPLPNLSPFKSIRKSITNFSPRRSVLLIDRRSLIDESSKSDQTKEQNEEIRIQVVTPRLKKRRSSKRKNEAEKLQEESSKTCSNEGNIFNTRRALRSRLILTPKSPLVRVKRSAQQMKSRKISLTSLNKFLSRDVVIELERAAPRSEESPEKSPPEAEVPEPTVPVDKNEVDSLQKQILPKRDVRIILEKLPPTITSSKEVETEEDVSSPSSSPSKRTASCLEPPKRETSKVFKSSEHAPLREIRIMLDKLPDTVFTSAIETPRLNETDTRPIDMEEVDEGVKVLSPEIVKDLAHDVDDHSEIPTPTTEIAPEQLFSPVTPIVVSESQPSPVSTPASGAVDNIETGGKKTPKSLDIPLRRVTIVKSKFAKLNRALDSSPDVTPVKVRPTSTYLFSPSVKSKSAKSNEATTQASDNTSSLEPSIVDVVSASSSSTVENEASVSESSQSAVPPPSCKISSATLESKSRTDAANISHRNEPIKLKLKFSKTKQMYVPMSTVSSELSSGTSKLSKSQNKAESVAVKKIPKTSAASTLKKPESEQPSVESPPCSQAIPLCTEISSPLSRGQLLTAKSLASSPNPTRMILAKSPSHLTQSAKSNVSKNTGAKTPSKSPLNRGRMLTEQSLAASPKHAASGSAGSILQRSHSNMSSGSKAMQNVTYRQKWASAGDLLRASSKERDGKMNTKSDTDLSTVITPLDPLPTTGVFSNARTCASILSTLKSADRNKSKSAPEKLPQRSTAEVTRPSYLSPKTPTAESGSRSQPDLSEKLSKVQIDSTKTGSESSQPPKTTFHIPKVKPGDSFNFKKPITPPPSSSLPKSGFTPSPPTKASLVGAVLGTPTFVSSSNTAPRYARQLPTKFPRTGNSNTFSAKSNMFRSVSSSARPHYVPGSQASSAKPPQASYYHSSAIKPPYTAQSLPAKPTHPSSFYSAPNVGTLTKFNDPRLHSASVSTSARSNDPRLHSANVSASAKSNDPRLQAANVPATSTKSNDPRLQAPNVSTTSTKPSDLRSQAVNVSATSTKLDDLHLHDADVPSSPQPSDPRLHLSTAAKSHSSNIELSIIKPYSSTSDPPLSTKSTSIPPYQPPPSKSKTPITTPAAPKSHLPFKPPITTPAAPKSHLPFKPITDYKPASVKTPSTNKSKPRTFKTAYMSSRSSNNDSFSKCLPSGPQYSPSYSKYLQNGFSYIPKAQYKVPEAPKPAAPKQKPPSPGTNEILRWSTSRPWNVNKPTASPPVGPSGSLTASVLSSNPAYSPLCPQFDSQGTT
ncbi:mucin-2-like [Planococcus citri]|uniref:mucin-2-like n=1 Tax=Planococcus citri TaxID=170843 RepID=UPI0031F8E56D